MSDFLGVGWAFPVGLDARGRFARGFDADTPPDRIAQQVRELVRHATGESPIDNQGAW